MYILGIASSGYADNRVGDASDFIVDFYVTLDSEIRVIYENNVK